MSERRQVKTIQGALSSIDALRVVTSLVGDSGTVIETDILYPYYCFDVDCQVPTLVGRKNISLICLVDAINGLGATADSFRRKNETVPETSLLSEEINDDVAAETAHRTVTHCLSKKMRTIASFDVSLLPRELIYKRFWIVKSRGVRVMVDSTTGGLCPLKLRAA